MNDQDLDRLLEPNLSGDPPRQVFRARVLLDSTAALGRRRRIAGRWRMAGLSAAAVVIAAVSFLLGRCSAPRGETDAPIAAATAVASESGTASVPSELVAWMDAARFFRQLGMEDRMTRAYERANELLPRDATAACGAAERMLAAVDEGGRQTDDTGTPGLPRPGENGNRIMAQVWGD